MVITLQAARVMAGYTVEQAAELCGVSVEQCDTLLKRFVIKIKPINRTSAWRQSWSGFFKGEIGA